MKFSQRETLAAGLADAPLTIIKRVDSFFSLTVQVNYDPGTVDSAGALYSSADYDEETGLGEWNLVPGSAQVFDETNGGVHTWRCRKFLEPYLKIDITGNVEALVVTFIGEPNQARLSPV